MDFVVFFVFVGSMYLAGRIAEHRGRGVKNWLWIAAVIGPLALPVLFLFPNLNGRNGDHACLSVPPG